MSDEENIETNPFFEVVRDSVAHRDSLQEKDEAEQKKAYQEHQKVLSQSKTHLANDVRSAIKAIPPMKLNVEGSIEFESEAFAWMIRDEKPYPLNGEEKVFIYGAGSSVIDRGIKNKGSSHVLFDRTGHNGVVRCVSYSPDGLTIASCSDDRTVRIWSAQSGELLRTMEGHTLTVNSVCYSPDGKTIASGSHDKTIRLWNAKTGAPIRTLSGHEGAVWSVSYAPDGTKIASGSADNTIRLWNAKTGAFVKSLTGVTPVSLSYSPDGGAIATPKGGLIRIFNVETGEEIRRIDAHRNAVRSLSFSPDGTSLASCCSTTFRLWDVQSGKEHHMRHAETQFESVCFSSDEGIIIGATRMCLVYDVNTRRVKKMDIGTPSALTVSSAFREASEVFNVVKETNKHLGELGFEIRTENGLEFTLSWYKRIE